MRSTIRAACGRAVVAVVAFVLVTVTGGLVGTPHAGAHTDFESSEPGVGEVVDHPISEIIIRFSGPAAEAGDGFEVLTPTGEIVRPDVERSDDERTFTLTFDEPLVNGLVGVRWAVRAGDSHPIEGSFSFATTAPEPTPPPTLTPVPTPEPSPTAAPSPTATSEVPSAEPEANTPPAATAPTAATAPPEATTPPPSGTAASAGEETSGAGVPTTPPVGEQAGDTSDEGAEVLGERVTTIQAGDLDAFLETDRGTSAADIIGHLGRLLSVPSALTAIGVSILGLSGTGRSLVRHLLPLVVTAAAMMFVGAVVEGAALLAEDADLLMSSAGLAVALRIAAAVVLGLVGLGQVPAKLPAVMSGVVLALVSYLFDGHTVTEGNRLLTGVADVVHVAGGAVWLGGLAALVYLTRPTRIDTVRAELARFIAEFSTIASVALAAIGAAGLGLAVTILDAPSDLWSTPWGRVLIVKTVVVAAALAIGAYNHFSVVPSIEAGEPGALARIARVLRTELALVLGAALATAVLVTAAT